MEIGALCPVRSLSSHVQFTLERAHQLVTRGNNVAPRLLGRIQCQTELPLCSIELKYGGGCAIDPAPGGDEDKWQETPGVYCAV